MTGKDDLPEKDEAGNERFDRTLRNLLNTPPKPHKAETAVSEKGGRDKPDRRGRKPKAG